MPFSPMTLNIKGLYYDFRAQLGLQEMDQMYGTLLQVWKTFFGDAQIYGRVLHGFDERKKSYLLLYFLKILQKKSLKKLKRKGFIF